MQDEGKVAFAEDVHLKLNSRCFVLLMSVMTDIRFRKRVIICEKSASKER